MSKIELLAPAGNLERLQVALQYGADAVYMAGKKFGLRAFAENFDEDGLVNAVNYAHNLGKKVYVTVNIFANNDDIDALGSYFKYLEQIGADAAIVSDLGVLAVARESAPNLPIHISTQANTCNYSAAKMWHKLGASRIILAREVSLDGIKRIRDEVGADLELEAFVHGAMCMSYSGRCLLSNFMTGRGANHGECAQPCRWNYYVMEEKRQGELMQLMEDERGSYVFNANDLCMIEYIPQLALAGISSFKIEGRMKTVNYTATVTKQYREALDRFEADPNSYEFDNYWLEELDKASHRPFSTGFFFGKPSEKSQCYDSSVYLRDYGFIGKVIGYDNDKKLVKIEQRNHFKLGETVEIMPPKGKHITLTLSEMFNEDFEPITVAPHPQQTVYIPFDEAIEQNSIMRRK